MNLLYNSIFLEHDTGAHPESRKRLEQFNHLPDTPLLDGREYLELIHTGNYIRSVKQASNYSAALDGDTITSPGS
ncbi:MAG: histone deacetylase family protein, partial [Saprospiraceae bacterium]